MLEAENISILWMLPSSGSRFTEKNSFFQINVANWHRQSWIGLISVRLEKNRFRLILSPKLDRIHKCWKPKKVIRDCCSSIFFLFIWAEREVRLVSLCQRAKNYKSFYDQIVYHSKYSLVMRSCQKSKWKKKSISVNFWFSGFKNTTPLISAVYIKRSEMPGSLAVSVFYIQNKNRLVNIEQHISPWMCWSVDFIRRANSNGTHFNQSPKWNKKRKKKSTKNHTLFEVSSMSKCRLYRFWFISWDWCYHKRKPLHSKAVTINGVVKDCIAKKSKKKCTEM